MKATRCRTCTYVHDGGPSSKLVNPVKRPSPPVNPRSLFKLPLPPVKPRSLFKLHVLPVNTRSLVKLPSLPIKTETSETDMLQRPDTIRQEEALL